MINSIEQFNDKYKKSAVVNYDIADVHGYGLTYKTAPGTVEIFRKDNGKYLEYPNIQPYSRLENTDYKLFIIKDNKIFELCKGEKDGVFKIKSEATDIDINIFRDIFYLSKTKHKQSANRKDEPIYIIEE